MHWSHFLNPDICNIDLMHCKTNWIWTISKGGVRLVLRRNLDTCPLLDIGLSQYLPHRAKSYHFHATTSSHPDQIVGLSRGRWEVVLCFFLWNKQDLMKNWLSQPKKKWIRTLLWYVINWMWIIGIKRFMTEIKQRNLKSIIY